jgi:hypothetical protein
LIALPQAVHLVFSKNCCWPHRLFSHMTISDWRHRAQRVSAAKAAAPQKGQMAVNARPQAEHSPSVGWTGFRHAGHRKANGLALAQRGQARAERSTKAPQCRHAWE